MQHFAHKIAYVSWITPCDQLPTTSVLDVIIFFAIFARLETKT